MEKDAIIIQFYETDDGHVPFVEWMNALDLSVLTRVEARLARIRDGNLGNTRSLPGGLHEIRFSFGAGYRIYFAWEGKTIIIFFCAGGKQSQQRDIRRAQRYYEQYMEHRNG